MLYDLSTNEEKVKEAFYWYEKASAQGVIIAQNNLAKMYYMGRGTPKVDKAKALYWYTKASDASNPIAQANLAMMYMLADGVEENIPKAIELLTKSAEQDNLSAIIKLADIYGKGNIVTQDYTKSFYW
jgi:TPR repeat protein